MGEYKAVTYEKHKDLETPGKSSKTEIEFKCGVCKSENITITPMNVEYRMNGLHDSIGDDIKYMFTSVPFIHSAILRANEQDGVFFECRDCDSINSIYKKINKQRLKRKVEKLYGPQPYTLGSE